jgi:hypothetical protein
LKEAPYEDGQTFRRVCSTEPPRQDIAIRIFWQRIECCPQIMMAGMVNGRSVFCCFTAVNLRRSRSTSSARDPTCADRCRNPAVELADDVFRPRLVFLAEAAQGKTSSTTAAREEAKLGDCF